MSNMSIVLVARPDQGEIIRAICSRMEIAAVLNTTRSRISDIAPPVYGDMGSLRVRVSPRLCCFLTPYRSLKNDLFTCLDNKIHVLGAGPPPLSRPEFDRACSLARENQVSFYLGGRHTFSPLYNTLLDAARKPAFGNPVYLRMVSGGGSDLLPAWWSAYDSLVQAEGLLGSNLEDLHVAAHKKGRKHHITLTASMANRANAQLVIAPVYFPFGADITLLGSGGLLSGDSLGNASPTIGEDGIGLNPNTDLYPDPAWLEDFLGRLDGRESGLPDWSGFKIGNRLRSTIRNALESRGPVRMKIPR